MELHHGLDQLRAEGIKLYAISYDDVDALAAYTEASGVGFPLLSDVDSHVIRQYGVLNTIVQPEDVPFHGIPFPGFFLVDEDGTIVDKLFNRHLANREGVETIVDSFLGRIERGRTEPAAAVSEDDGIRIEAFVRGGGGVLRIGPRRRLVVRFAMPEGLHVYDDPVPDGMVPVRIEVEGPDGLRFESVESPPTAPFELPGVDATLQVWDGEVDFVVPMFANTELGPILRKQPNPSIELRVHVRYQACDDAQCFLPRRHIITLDVPITGGPLPAIGAMKGRTGDVIDMDSETHLRRLVERKVASGAAED